jgi:hypothetical protein
MTTVTHIPSGRTYEYTTDNAAQAVIWCMMQNDYGHRGIVHYIDPKGVTGYRRTPEGHRCNDYSAPHPRRVG